MPVLDLHPIAVDSTHVYWAEQTPQCISKEPLTGGGPIIQIACGTQIEGIAVDSTGVYWADMGDGGPASGAVYKVGLAGGAVTTLAAAQNTPVGLALDSTSVYWAESATDGVMKVGLDGGGLTTLVAGTAFNGGVIALTSTNVYWVQMDPNGVAPTAIMSVQLDGGMPTTIGTTTVPVSGDYMAVVADDAHVYWNDPLYLVKALPDGGEAARIAELGLNVILLTLSDAGAYWEEGLNPADIMGVVPR